MTKKRRIDHINIILIELYNSLISIQGTGWLVVIHHFLCQTVIIM